MTLEKLKEESNGKAAIACEDEGNTEGVDVLIAAKKHPTGEWILDLDVLFIYFQIENSSRHLRV